MPPNRGAPLFQGDINDGARQFVNNLLTIGEKTECEPEALPDVLPPWFDLNLFQKGQNFYHKHIFAMYFAKLSGLITILAIPSILKVLRFTKMSITPETSFRRYVATILHMHQWYTCDITNKESKLWKSLNEVRILHLKASKRSQKACMGRITQKDMALTQFGFIGYQLLHPYKVGIHKVNDDEFQAFIHVWRTVGYMLGMKDEFNICRNSITETKSICHLLVSDVFRPKIQQNNHEFIEMVSVLIDGMWSFNPVLNKKTFLRTIWDLCDLTIPTDRVARLKSVSDNYLFKMSFFDQFIYLFTMFVQRFLLRFRYIRAYYNAQKYLSLFLIEYFPFLAFHRFGFRNSFVNIYKYNK